ncbi:MAG: AAA family ATPase [Lentisphaeraceae bacterium]|nr:AAA family ATPase [Lentisphaeraceae bacterium]
MSEFLKDEEVKKASIEAHKLIDTLNGVIFGQEELIRLSVTGLLAGGHLLLEGLPGLGKTELIKGLSKAVNLDFKRIQFTPDLLPGDISGNPVFQERDGRREFIFQPGPIFANLVLADEINRASPKTQSAMLEAMQEHSVTVMGHTHQLPSPFFVLATQNPIELEGTYKLPEAQLDRFLFKLEIRQTNADVLQRIILERELGVSPKVEEIMSKETLQNVCKLVRQVHLSPVVASYISRLVDATHPGRSTAAASVKFGASPRAAIALATASKAAALIEGRIHVGFEDIKKLAHAVLRHRIILDYRARLEGHTTDSIIDALLKEVHASDKELPPAVSVN